MAETISHWIDGEGQDGHPGRTALVFDPTTGRERDPVAATAGERRLYESLVAGARVMQSQKLAFRAKELLRDRPQEEIDTFEPTHGLDVLKR
jgi:hypothetical protein